MSSIFLAGWAAALGADAGFEFNLTMGAAAVCGAGAAAATAAGAARVGTVGVAARAVTGAGLAALVRAVRLTDRFATEVVVVVDVSDAGAAALLSVAEAG
jgi:hypothetical protein